MAILCFDSILFMLSLTSLIQAYSAAKHNAINDLSRRNTSSMPRTVPGFVPYGTIITTCTTPGVVALTFDDGPGPYTAKLLDLLASNDIKATFFLLGNHTVHSVYAKLVKRMYREGHQIASHTWDHQSLESLSSADRQREMIKNEIAFENMLGVFPTYMRPPYGFCYAASGCLTDMAALGYHVIGWNIDTKDYENNSPALVQTSKNLFNTVFWSGDSEASSFIPLTHDIHQQTVVTLVPYMIQVIRAEGYKFMTVGECLGDPAKNWYRNATIGESSQ